MVKANAYGHGDRLVVGALQAMGVRDFGVALIEEGIGLRAAGFTDEHLYVFGVFDGEGARAVIEHRLTPVLSRMDQIENLIKHLPNGARFPVHLKFNTGMNRLGFEVAEAIKIAEILHQTPQLSLTGICTHLACAEDLANPDGNSHTQLTEFQRALKAFPSAPAALHVYNSSGMTISGSADFGVRPGITLYGETPLDLSPTLPVVPVMTVASEIVMIHHLKVGATVSYGAVWKARRPSVVATVAMGYADGLNRALARGGEMLYRGQRVPIAGTVCMDYTMIDITDAVADRPPQLGEEVVIFGQQDGQFLKASEVAQRLGTIAYEVFVNISARVPREPK
jgi:alanine racemase